jgi:hypothetical protein
LSKEGSESRSFGLGLLVLARRFTNA